MKNFIFKSSLDKDLLKIFQKLDLIQKEQRHARYDLQVILTKVETCVKGIAIMVCDVPEDTAGEEIGTNNDNPTGE